jgi:hypothetical protein
MGNKYAEKTNGVGMACQDDDCVRCHVFDAFVYTPTVGNQGNRTKISKSSKKAITLSSIIKTNKGYYGSGIDVYIHQGFDFPYTYLN